MSMSEWAKKEIEIACQKEIGNAPEGEWDYGCSCYGSALKAFKSLVEDGHSGMSIGITKNILNRLIDGKPLTPIEDTDDIWGMSYRNEIDKYTSFQCSRMSSLFKYVYDDGTIKFSDNDSCYCVSQHDPNISWTNGFIRGIIEEMFPITMPYYPTEKSIKVVCDEFLFDEVNGDFDTMAILYCIKPDGERVNVNRFFKESETGFVEIGTVEYARRYCNRKFYNKRNEKA